MREIYDFFDAEEKGRFDALNPEIQEMYFSGSLNPKLIYDAIMIDDRFLVHEHIDDLATDQVINILSRTLEQLKRLAQHNQCDIIICLVPYAPYVDQASGEAFREMGFEWDESLLTSTASAEAIQKAAEMAEIPFYSPLEQFRSMPSGTAYYHYDSHLTPKGADIYAEFIADVLKGKVSKASN